MEITPFTFSTEKMPSREYYRFINMKKTMVKTIIDTFTKFNLPLPDDGISLYPYERLLIIYDDLFLLEKCEDLVKPYMIQEWTRRFVAQYN